MYTMNNYNFNFQEFQNAHTFFKFFRVNQNELQY